MAINFPSSPANGATFQVGTTTWTYYSDSQSWRANYALTSGSINGMNDVDTLTVAPTTGQYLKWDGTNWVPNNVSGTVGGNLIPSSTNTYSLGNSTYSFSSLYVSGNTIYIDRTPLSASNGTIGATSINANSISVDRKSTRLNSSH